LKVNLGGVVSLSTVDWTGSATTVVFLRGCPLRCPHCQNPELQSGENQVELHDIMSQIVSQVKGEMKNTSTFFDNSGQIDLNEACDRVISKPFVKALVLSGGEPLMQPKSVSAMFRLARDLGLKTGLETSGCYPDQLSEILQENLVDKVFLDVKADLNEHEYTKAVGVRGIAPLVRESLRTCMVSGVELEIRTTVFPEMPSDSEVVEIARTLNELKSENRGNRLDRMVLQQGLPRNREFEPVPLDRLRLLAESLKDLVEVQIGPISKGKIDGTKELDAASLDSGMAKH
jgi:pyruvate formate lyase activating enzyme